MIKLINFRISEREKSICTSNYMYNDYFENYTCISATDNFERSFLNRNEIIYN